MNKETAPTIEELALDQLATKLQLNINPYLSDELRYQKIKIELNNQETFVKLKKIFLNKFQKELNLNINPDLSNKTREELIKKKVNDPEIINSLPDEILDGLAKELMLDINDNIIGQERYKIIRDKFKNPLIAHIIEYKNLDAIIEILKLDENKNTPLSLQEKINIAIEECDTHLIEYNLSDQILGEFLQEKEIYPYHKLSCEKKYKLIQKNIENVRIVDKVPDNLLKLIAKKMELNTNSDISDLRKELSNLSNFDEFSKTLHETLFPKNSSNLNLYYYLYEIVTKNNQAFFELSEIFDKNFLEKNNLILKRVYKYGICKEAFNEDKDFLLKDISLKYAHNFVELIDKKNSNNSIIIDPNLLDYRKRKGFFIGSKQELLNDIMNLLTSHRDNYRFKLFQSNAHEVNDAIFNNKVQEKHCDIVINDWYGKKYSNRTTNLEESLIHGNNSNASENIDNTPTFQNQNRATESEFQQREPAPGNQPREPAPGNQHNYTKNEIPAIYK